MPIKGLKLWRFDNTISEFWAYVHCAYTETPIYELTVKNLTSTFASVTPISCNRGALNSVRIHVRYVSAISLVRMCRNSINSTFGLKTPLSDHDRPRQCECFKGDEASQWKRPKFDPSPHQNPLTDLHQNWPA